MIDESRLSNPVLTRHEDGRVTVEWPNGKLGYTVWADNMVEEFVAAKNQIVALTTLIDTMVEDHEELLADLKTLRQQRDAALVTRARRQ